MRSTESRMLVLLRQFILWWPWVLGHSRIFLRKTKIRNRTLF